MKPMLVEVLQPPFPTGSVRVYMTAYQAQVMDVIIERARLNDFTNRGDFDALRRALHEVKHLSVEPRS